MFPGSSPPSVVLKSIAENYDQVNFTAFNFANANPFVKFATKLDRYPNKKKKSASREGPRFCFSQMLTKPDSLVEFTTELDQCPDKKKSVFPGDSPPSTVLKSKAENNDQVNFTVFLASANPFE